MESQKYVSLNSIISYVYRKKNNIENIDYQSNKYKSFLNDYKDKIKEICEALDIDLQVYKSEQGVYNIPYLLGEILKVYLKQDGKKGSIISKIKIRKYDKITYEEKVRFIDEVTEILKMELNDDEVISVVEWLNGHWKVKGKVNKDIKELAEDTKVVVNNFIDAIVSKIAGIKETDGLVSLNQYRIINLENIEDNISIEELLEKFKYNRIPHKESLTFDDKVILIDYLKYWIIDNIKDFLYVADDFSQLREEDISINLPKNYKKSEELLKESIHEYRNMIIEKRIPKKLPPDNEDEIMKEIRKEYLKE